MPITLPAHAAGALPFVKLTPRWLHPSALIVGCCAPDLAYLFNESRDLSHSFRYGVQCGVLVGLLFFAWFELLVFPVIRTRAPSFFGVDIERMFEARWPRSGRAWFTVVVALALGALTHVVWDGFTHHGWWPAIAVYPARYERLATRIAWNASTVVGSIVVMLAAWRHYPATRPQRVERIAWLAFLCTVLVAVVVFPLARRNLPPDAEVPHWPAQLMAMRAVFVTATIWCLALNRLAPHRRDA